MGGGDRGGGRPGEKGAGGVREAGEEGAGSGIPKVVGSGRKREKLRNIAQYFAIEKMQRAGSPKIQAGNRDYRVREAGGLNPPVPPPTILWRCCKFPFRIRSLPFLRHLENFETLLTNFLLKRKPFTTQNRTRSFLALHVISLRYHYTTTPICHNSEKLKYIIHL